MIRMIEITDFHAPELDIFARKTEAQLLNKDHPEEGMFIAESPKVIERALNAGYTPVAVLVEKKQIEGEAASVLARCDEIPVYTAEFDVLAQLTGFKLTRGMLCAMRRRGLPEVEKVCQNAKKVAVLENVMNPTNVGAIFRSAAALNMDAVLLTGGKMVEAMDIYAYSTPLFLACKQAMYYRVLHHDGQERLPALSLDATAKANVYNKMRDLELL